MWVTCFETASPMTLRQIPYRVCWRIIYPAFSAAVPFPGQKLCLVNNREESFADEPATLHLFIQ